MFGIQRTVRECLLFCVLLISCELRSRLFKSYLTKRKDIFRVFMLFKAYFYFFCFLSSPAYHGIQCDHKPCICFSETLWNKRKAEQGKDAARFSCACIKMTIITKSLGHCCWRKAETACLLSLLIDFRCSFSAAIFEECI